MHVYIAYHAHQWLLDRSAKLVEKKQAAQVVAAQKQAQAAEADAFRGVHLGSGHHWDEVSAEIVADYYSY